MVPQSFLHFLVSIGDHFSFCLKNSPIFSVTYTDDNVSCLKNMVMFHLEGYF